MTEDDYLLAGMLIYLQLLSTSLVSFYHFWAGLEVASSPAGGAFDSNCPRRLDKPVIFVTTAMMILFLKSR